MHTQSFLNLPRQNGCRVTKVYFGVLDVLVHHKHFWRSFRVRSSASWVRILVHCALIITWAYAHPSAPQAYQCKITQSTGMAKATRAFFQPDFLERESLSGLRREKNQQQSQVRLNFKVFNDVDNRAKANRVIKGG